jgi:predicted HicB family RNase H-like nuclease
MNAMTYKDYAARIEFDAEDRLFVGRIAGIRDIVTFHADTVNDLEAAFHEAVDDYLAACKAFGKPPAKAASGKILLRIPPEVHARAMMYAEAAGQSLNTWASEKLAQFAR